MKKLFRTKKRVALAATIAVLAAVAGAYAYYTVNGSGTGSGGSATPSALVVSQVGAGYDSLSPTNVYHQDQTFGGAGISEFGDDITLATSGTQQRLTSVVVAFRNWGPEFGPNESNGVPITLSIAGGPSDTVTPEFDGANPITGRPTVTNVTFDFTGTTVWVPQTFLYGISFDASGAAGGLNVALSSSTGGDLVVGTDAAPGNVWLKTSYSSIGNDFPACSTPGGSVPTGVYEEVSTDCGPQTNPNNYGAYGNGTPATQLEEDIPAVEFNVVGGVVPPVVPGGPTEPIDFAITNPGGATQHVNAVTTSISSISNSYSVNGGYPQCVAGWFSIAPASQAINADVAGGTTVFETGTTLSMPADSVDNQDNCEGATLNLAFTAS